MRDNRLLASALQQPKGSFGSFEMQWDTICICIVSAFRQRVALAIMAVELLFVLRLLVRTVRIQFDANS